MKFEIKVPHNVREALTKDKEKPFMGRSYTKGDTVLDQATAFIYHLPSHKVNKKYQYAPLRIIFDVKQEDLRRKGRMVVGRHGINSTIHQSYTSVVHIRALRLLQTITINEDLNMMGGDIGNAIVQT